jgi:hypothetical protein
MQKVCMLLVLITYISFLLFRLFYLFCLFLLITSYVFQLCLLPFLSIHLPVSTPILDSLPATCYVCSPNNINYPIFEGS